MKVFENEIQRLVYDEFGDELEEKDKEIETLTKSNKAYKKKIEELKEIGDTNSPKAQEIIKSLMLI
jgi:chaperonin cofactor prefoldin